MMLSYRTFDRRTDFKSIHHNANHQLNLLSTIYRQTNVWHNTDMSTGSLSQLLVRPERILRNAETNAEKFHVLAECYADCRAWISEDSDEIASLKADVRRLKAEVARLQKQPENGTKKRVLNDARR